MVYHHGPANDLAGKDTCPRFPWAKFTVIYGLAEHLPHDLICLAANYICVGITLYIVQLYGNRIGLPQIPFNSPLSLEREILIRPYVRGPVLFPDDPRKVWDLISLQAEASSNLIQQEAKAKEGSLPSILHKPAKG